MSSCVSQSVFSSITSHVYRSALYANPLRPIQHSYHNLTKLFLLPFMQNASEVNRRSNESHRTIFYMVSSHLDFGDCMLILLFNHIEIHFICADTSTPKSEVIVHTLSRSGSKPEKDADYASWVCRFPLKSELRTKAYTGRTFIKRPYAASTQKSCASCRLLSPKPEICCCMLVLLGHRDQSTSPRKLRLVLSKSSECEHITCLPSGGPPTTIRSDLRDDENWQPSTISSTIEKLGRECKALIPIYRCHSDLGDSTTQCGCITQQHLGNHCIPFGPPCFCALSAKKKTFGCVSMWKV